MFIELHTTRFNYHPGLTASVTVEGIRPLNKVVNVESIRSIDMEAITVDGVDYHKVNLTYTTEDDELPTAHLYVTAADYKRLIH